MESMIHGKLDFTETYESWTHKQVMDKREIMKKYQLTQKLVEKHNFIESIKKSNSMKLIPW